MRSYTNKIFVEGLPPEWGSNEIAARFGIMGKIIQINLVKNTTGFNTGKAIVEFDDQKTALDTINKFNDYAIDNMVNKIKPYFENKEKDQSPRKSLNYLQRRLYLMNIPYDTSVKDIRNLVQEFVAIDEVVIPRDNRGYPKGYAFVYLQHSRDIDKAVEYIDGRHLKDRQIRAKKHLLPTKQQKKTQIENSEKDSDMVNIDKQFEYLKFLKSAILSRLCLNETNKSESNQQEINDPFISQFLNVLQLYANQQSITIDQAFEEALDSLRNRMDASFKKEFTLVIKSSEEQRKKHENKLEQEGGDKDKYPGYYLMSKITEQYYKELGVPQQVLYPPVLEKAKPFGLTQLDSKYFF